MYIFSSKTNSFDITNTLKSSKVHLGLEDNKIPDEILSFFSILLDIKKT